MTWASKQDHNNVHTLALIVVWKGSEGWHSRCGLGDGSGGGAERWFEYTVRDGGLELKVRSTR